MEFVEAVGEVAALQRELLAEKDKVIDSYRVLTSRLEGVIEQQLRLLDRVGSLVEQLTRPRLVREEGDLG